MHRTLCVALGLSSLLAVSCAQPSPATAPAQTSSNVFKNEDGFVDANGVLIYYQAFGAGRPLLILHGGPGASHDDSSLICCRSREPIV